MVLRGSVCCPFFCVHTDGKLFQRGMEQEHHSVVLFAQIVIKHQLSLSWRPPVGLDCSFSLLNIMAKEKSIWDPAQIEGARLREGSHILQPGLQKMFKWITEQTYFLDLYNTWSLSKQKGCDFPTH